MYYALFYDYVDNIVERRAPHREAHLKLARESMARGELRMGGAFADPIDGALLVFEAKDASVVEDFVKNDPYVAARLIKSWRIRPWTVVVGGQS